MVELFGINKPMTIWNNYCEIKLISCFSNIVLVYEGVFWNLQNWMWAKDGALGRGWNGNHPPYSLDNTYLWIVGTSVWSNVFQLRAFCEYSYHMGEMKLPQARHYTFHWFSIYLRMGLQLVQYLLPELENRLFDCC